MLPDCSFLSVCFSDKEADTAHRATEAESVRLCQRDDWALIAKTAASRLCACVCMQLSMDVDVGGWICVCLMCMYA